MNKRAFLILAFTALLSPALFAGWSEMQRLTYRGGEYAPKIIARNDTLHVAWYQIADSQKVSYLRSINNGQNWGDLLDLSAWGHRGVFVNLTQDRGKLLAGWADYPPSGHANMGYSLTEDGNNWTVPAYIIGGGSIIDLPTATALSGDSIYGVYYAYNRDSTGNRPFRFLYSSDLGQTWSNEQTVAYSFNYCNSLLINKCGGVLYIVFTGNPVPESTTFETQVVLSRDGGQTWSEKTILSQNGGWAAQAACLSCNRLNGFLAVGWMDYGYPGYLYLRITENLGYNWGPEIQAITSHLISSPNLEFVADTLWAAWVDHSFTDHWQLGYSRSTDRGITWEAPQRLTETSGGSLSPWLSYDHGKLHLVWEERASPPDNNTDIYYKWWEAGSGINWESDQSQNEHLICYPNPFNTKVRIDYSNVKGGEIHIYDISGRLIRFLQVKDKNEGQVIWDATDGLGQPIASGIYIAKARLLNGFNTTKLIHLK
jgi:hypothetical protein